MDKSRDSSEISKLDCIADDTIDTAVGVEFDIWLGDGIGAEHHIYTMERTYQRAGKS